MDLLPQELRKTLPSLYSQESSSAPIVHALCSTGHTVLCLGSSYVVLIGSDQANTGQCR